VNDKMLTHIPIPHSSMYIPKEYADSFSADSETVLRNHIALTDFATDILFFTHNNKIGLFFRYADCFVM
jgi:hypothetical protein